MAFAETQKLIVDLSMKGNFASSLKGAESSLAKFDRKITNTQGRAYKAGQQIGTGIKSGAIIAAGAIGFLATQVGFGLRALSELESITAQSNAVLKSTKGVAGQTADSLRKLAEKYEDLNATIDDKVIQSGANVLLTFTNIRKKGFEPALQAALDMNQALGGGEEGLQGAIQKVGKALNDPIKGLGLLSRVGITFTEGQKKQIKAAVKAGDTFKAQGVILAELNKRFGGSFLAGGATTQGKIAKFKDSIEDLQKALATALLPAIGKVADGLSKFLKDPAVVRGVDDLGKSIAGLFSDANLKAGGDFLKGAFETAKEAAPVVAAGAKATFGLVQAAVGLFKSLPPEIQKLAVGAFAINKLTGGLVTNIAGGIIDVVGKQFLQRGGTPANPLFVKEVGLPGIPGGPGVPGTGGGLGGFVKGAAALAGGIGISIIGIEALGELIKATSTPEQLAANERNRIEQEILKRSFGRTTTAPNDPKTGGLSPEERDILHDQAQKLQDIKDADLSLVKIGRLQTSASVLAFRSVTNALRNAQGKNVGAAIKSALESIFVKGQGGSGGAANVLAALKAQLKNTHDPRLAATLRSAIGRVEHKLAARQIVEGQLKKADQIWKSNLTNAQKIDRLKDVQRAIGNRNVIATRRVQEKIDAAKRAQVAATNRSTSVIAAKKFSATLYSTVKVINNVNAREVGAAVGSFVKYFSTASGGSSTRARAV